MKDTGFHRARYLTPLIAAILLLAGSSVSTGTVAPRSRQKSESDPPAAEAILDKYIRATGGSTAYRDLHNIVSRGTFQVTGTSLRGKYAAYEAEPNKTHTVFDFESGEISEQGTLGEQAWERSSSGGARLLQGEERTVALREAIFNSMLDWRGIYRKAAYVGTEKIGERTCYKLALTPASGKPLTQYFDVESGLLLKSYIMLNSPTGDIRSENLYDDYRKVNVEVLFPHKLVQRIPNEEIVITLESVRCNVDIASYLFDLPPQIKALSRGGPGKQ
jgi:hypothetical protein